MSYAQLAEIRGISKKAAQRLTLRHQWRRQPANDGGVLILVPDDAVTPGRQTGRHNGVSDGPDVVALLEDANRRADAALAVADRALAELADANTERAAALARAERAEALITNLEADIRAKEIAA